MNNKFYEDCLAYLEDGVENWGQQGFIPYGDGFDPSRFVKNS